MKNINVSKNITKNSYFSSDYHFGHNNVIKYDNRPFSSIEEMDERIINNHNNTVRPEDDFYFLGDFSFDKKKTEWYLSQLNGNKFFIEGNHDHSDTIKLYKKYGNFLGKLEEIIIQEKKITLCHYAMKVFNRSHHGSWHLYGHSHHGLPDDPHSLSIDVGINGKDYNYCPVSFEEVNVLMSKKNFKPVDHHGSH